MNLERARELIVASGLELQHLINSNPEYAQYFENNHAEVRQFDNDIMGLSPTEGFDYIKVVFMIKGTLVYKTEGDPMKPYIPVHEETFEEAVAILQKQANSN